MATPSVQPARRNATTTHSTQNRTSSRLRSSLAITLENADEVLEWQPDYSIIICRDHGYAVRSVAQHLRSYHVGKDIEKRAVVELFSKYRLYCLKDVPLLTKRRQRGRSMSTIPSSESGYLRGRSTVPNFSRNRPSPTSPFLPKTRPNALKYSQVQY